MRIRLAVVIAAFASALAAQTTHIVGPGGFATINAALAAAAPGDVVLVQAGLHAGFQATIGVTICAASLGAVFVTSASTVNSPAQGVHLVDLDLKFLSVTGSTCSLDRCRVTAIHGVNGACLLANNSRVHLHECVVGAAGDPPQVTIFFTAGLGAIASTITAVDSTFRGRDRDLMALGGASSGISLFSGSTFHGSRLVVRGGDGVSTGTLVPGKALTASPDSTAWISASTLAGGAATNLGPAPWQCPVEGALGRLVRCTLQPSTCAPPAIPQIGLLLGVHRVAPPQAGAPLQLDFDTVPNGLVGVFASFGVASLTLPDLEQPVCLDFAALIPLTLLVADGTGVATGAWSLPPGTANRTLWLQGAASGALPLQLSPVTGGVVR